MECECRFRNRWMEQNVCKACYRDFRLFLRKMCFHFRSFFFIHFMLPHLRFAIILLVYSSNCSGFAFINFPSDWDDTSVTTIFRRRHLKWVWGSRRERVRECDRAHTSTLLHCENPFNFMNLVEFPFKSIKHNFIHDYTIVSAVNIWMRWSKT